MPHPRVRSYQPMLCGLIFASALAACGRTDAPGSAAREGIQTGTYRVVLQLPGGELPFGLDLEHEGPGWTGYLINGPERLKINDVAVEGSHLEIKMPCYENRLTADRKAVSYRAKWS